MSFIVYFFICSFFELYVFFFSIDLDCHDLRGCAKHYFKGECSQGQWRTYLQKHCRKTCGFCKVTGGGGGTWPTQGPRPQTPKPQTPRPTSGNINNVLEPEG